MYLPVPFAFLFWYFFLCVFGDSPRSEINKSGGKRTQDYPTSRFTPLSQELASQQQH